MDELGSGVPAGLRAAVLAADGDAIGLDRFLRGQAAGEGGLFPAYFDEDFVRLFAADTFAELRKKYPDPRKNARPGS